MTLSTKKSTHPLGEQNREKINCRERIADEISPVALEAFDSNGLTTRDRLMVETNKFMFAGPAGDEIRATRGRN